MYPMIDALGVVQLHLIIKNKFYHDEILIDQDFYFNLKLNKYQSLFAKINAHSRYEA
jgi:hypothetical protein